jgi:hypothetical protein
MKLKKRIKKLIRKLVAAERQRVLDDAARSRFLLAYLQKCGHMRWDASRNPEYTDWLVKK